MPGFTESNITLNFPDNNFFRLADQWAYKKLSGNHFKEMDACWYDLKTNFYWLIELKDFSSASLIADSIEKKSWEIVKKAIDTLSMFLATKHTYPYTALDPFIPIQHPNNTTQFKFIIIVHCAPSQRADIQLINNKFKNKFKPYADLFGISHYAVVEHSIAIKNIPDNIVL